MLYCLQLVLKYLLGSERIACSFFLSDPKRNGLVELILQVGVGQLSEQQKDTLVRQLAVLLNVLDSDIKVQKIQAYSDIRYKDNLLCKEDL